MRNLMVEMMSSGELLTVLGGGLIVLCWYIYYIWSAVTAFKAKRFGVPAVAISLMWSYDLIFSVIFPTEPTALRIILFTWFLTDTVLLFQLFRYGRESYPWPEFRDHAFLVSLGTLIFSFAGLFTFILFYQTFTGDTVAYTVDAFVAVLTVVMVLNRPGAEGVSFGANLVRAIADTGAAIIVWLTDPFTQSYDPNLGPSGDNNPFTLFLFVLTITADVILLGLLRAAKGYREE